VVPCITFLWPPYGREQAIIFPSCGFFFFFYLSIFMFSSPNLSRRRLDICHTSTHGVALVRNKMQVWNVLHTARWKYRMQKSRQKSPHWHNHTNLLGYIFATKAHIENRKNC